MIWGERSPWTGHSKWEQAWCAERMSRESKKGEGGWKVMRESENGSEGQIMHCLVDDAKDFVMSV